MLFQISSCHHFFIKLTLPLYFLNITSLTYVYFHFAIQEKIYAKNIDINGKKSKINREVLNINRECFQSRDKNEEEAYETFS